MKKLILLFLIAILALSNTGCVPKNLEAEMALTDISQLIAIPKRNEIGFEWQPIEDTNVEGIYVYRAEVSEYYRELKIVGTVDNRFATHFVDKRVMPDHAYRYVFKTFNDYIESQGVEISIATPKALDGISFFSAYPMGGEAVKLLWRPHLDQSVASYIVERSEEREDFEPIMEVQGHLMSEYIDTDVSPKRIYNYRVFAKSYDGGISEPSVTTQVILK